MPPGYPISIVLTSPEHVFQYEQVLAEAARRCGYAPIRLPPGHGGNGSFKDPFILWAGGHAIIRYYVEADEDGVQMHVAATEQPVLDAILELCKPLDSSAN